MKRANEDAILRDMFRATAILSRASREKGASRRDVILGHLATREELMDEGMVERPFTQSKLAEILGITSQTLGETLARMEGDGLVSRQVCDGDRRSICVGLTDAGREASRSVMESRRAFAHDSLSCLDECERKQFASILRKLNQAL